MQKLRDCQQKPAKNAEKPAKTIKKYRKTRKMRENHLTKPAKCGNINPQKAENNKKERENMNHITLQIPINEYGQIATLAAAANMPLDQFVVQMGVQQKEADKKNK